MLETQLGNLLSGALGLVLLRKDAGANCIENKNFIFQVYKIVPITYNIMVKDSTAMNARSHINISSPTNAFLLHWRRLESGVRVRSGCCRRNSLLSAQECAKEPCVSELYNSWGRRDKRPADEEQERARFFHGKKKNLGRG